MNERKPRSLWRLGRRASAVAVWLVLLLAVCLLVALLGVQASGSVDAWQRWMAQHAWLFLGWRLLLYGATVLGWIWMRRRLQARESDPLAHQRLRRVEVSAIAAVLALEVSPFVFSG